ncbi:MAG: glycine--tRNA ligase subunit alpha [Candidatus Omnitrophota bacterium]
MTFQDIIMCLEKYWSGKGCLIAQPCDTEVGAGTFHPLTFFKSLGKAPWNTAFVQPSRRPTDGRYADNPLRTQRYYQYQVLLKPSPDDVQSLYLNSLENLGIDLKKHDFRFVEDDWESPTLGASGLGWEVWLDSLEVTQFTYFQQVGGIEMDLIPCEITYGLERIAMFIQGEYDLYNLRWDEKHTYGDIHKKDEIDCSKYNFEKSDPKIQRDLFYLYVCEAKRLLSEKLLIPAYEFMLKTSHSFNMLDARGAVSATERPACIAQVRALAKSCALLYLENIDTCPN